MENKKVRDIMVPLGEYAVVPDTATILDAVLALDRAQKRVPAGRAPHRAVLVVDKNGEVVGKVGQWSFLKSLEPKYANLHDLDTLTKAGVSDQFISSLMDHFRFFQDDLTNLCRLARDRHIVDIMRPVTEYIKADASLGDAIHLLVVRRTLSVLVKDGDRFVGLLRLSDLFREVSEQMKELASTEPNKGQE